MYSKRLEWKEHSLNLEMVDEWCRANLTGYVGNSADSALTLWFEEEPSEQDLLDADAYWDLLDEESEEATSYTSAQAIRDRIEELRVGIPGKAWNTLTTAEQKLVLGLSPTRAELWPEE
jgi:hypothetical protein